VNGENNPPQSTETELGTDITIEEEVDGRARILEHLPKMYKLMLDIPGTHRERMLQVLRVMTEGLP